MDGVVKTSILTAISAITVYAGLFLYLNGDDENTKKKKNTKNKKKKNKLKTTSILNASSSSSSSSSRSSSISRNSSDDLDIPYGSSNSINSENNNSRNKFLDGEDDDSHEISTSSSSDDFTQNSPRTLQDHLKILKSDDLSNHMAIKKLDSVHVLLSIVSYSESLALLSYLNSLSIVVDSLNSLLALEMISANQNSLIRQLGLLLGNLLQYPENHKKIMETRFIPTLVNLINDDDAERSDFSLFCLFNLSSNEECGTEIILSQGIKEIISLLESKKANISLKKQCLHILLNMYLESKNLREMISSENEQLINVLKIIKQTQKNDLSELASKILQIDTDHQNLINTNDFNDKNIKPLYIEDEEDEDDDE
ncbi:hypothetical protein ACTFIY_006973 [Dictyostelium cf. discoideum]